MDCNVVHDNTRVSQMGGDKLEIKKCIIIHF